jgi:hypothetical protein
MLVRCPPYAKEHTEGLLAENDPKVCSRLDSPHEQVRSRMRRLKMGVPSVGEKKEGGEQCRFMI